MIQLLTPSDGAAVSLQTTVQIRFIADEEGRRGIPGSKIFAVDDLYRTDNDDATLPLPVIFTWNGCKGDAELSVTEHGNPFSERRFHTEKREAEVYHLLPGKTYDWQVSADGETSEIRSFTVSDEAPRFIRVDGVSNFRDIGGWKTEDGNTLRQGILFRCGEFDSHSKITDEGRETVLHELGIRTDLDLRGEGELKMHGSPLSPDVRWINLPIGAYVDIFGKPYCREALQKIFNVLADPSVYPLCFHCWGGADRGGTLSLLIEGILGVPKENLILDYELTSLSVWGIRTRNYEPFADMMKRLDACGGTTFAEKIRTFLIGIGVSASDIDRFREIMLNA